MRTIYGSSGIFSFQFVKIQIFTDKENKYNDNAQPKILTSIGNV